MSIEFKTTINEKWDSKQFDEHSDCLIETIKNTVIDYLSSTFKDGKEISYIVNLVINSHISSLINTIITISENNKEMHKKIIIFSEKLLEFLGYEMKYDSNRTIN